MHASASTSTSTSASASASASASPACAYACAFAFAFVFVFVSAQPIAAQEPRAADAPSRIIDPAAEADAPPSFVSDEELARLAESDIQKARALLRRSARSSSSTPQRALALRLLATHDAGTATARICARALRTDIEALVRRGGAECLGRLDPDVAGPHTPALVAALDDGNLDVVTMAGWALANVGDAPAIGAMAKQISHPDSRVGTLFIGYADRMRARLGLVYETKDEQGGRDDKGNRYVPSGYVLVSQAHGLDLAASTGWLGLYGGVMGWYHGVFLLSAHGGTTGAEAAALAGLGGAAVGVAAGSAYAFTRADTLPLAHTVVQLGTAGAFAGYGAGLLSGFPPTSGVAAANLSFAGTLAGTAAGIALVETKPPTLGSLGTGLSAGLTVGVASGALFKGYGLRDETSIGAALLAGSGASVVATLATTDTDVGLFPLATSTAFAMAGGGAGALLALSAEPGTFTEASGWTIAGGTLAGAGAGIAVGMLMPRELDPLLSKELEMFPPAVAAIPALHGGPSIPAMVVAGRF